MAAKRAPGFVLGYLALVLAAAAVSHGLVRIEAWERELLQLFNPSRPVPGVDGLMVLVTDFTIGTYAVVLTAWAAACLLLREGVTTPARLARAFSVLAIVTGISVAAVDAWLRRDQWIVTLGSGCVAFLSLYQVGRRAGRVSPEAWARGIRLFGLTLLAVLLAECAEELIDLFAAYRPRPLAGENLDWNHVLRVVPGEEASRRTSFPSGHALTYCAMVMPLFVATRRRAVRIGLVASALVHSTSRLYLVAHFPGCVLVGSLVGLGIGALVATVLPLRLAAFPAGPARLSSPLLRYRARHLVAGPEHQG